MIAAILAVAATAIPAGTNHIEPIHMCTAGSSVPCISVGDLPLTAVLGGRTEGIPPLQMDMVGALVFAHPPCGTPEAAKANACVNWKVDPTNPYALGYQSPVRVESPGR